MISKSCKLFIGLIITLSIISPLKSDEKIDIWKKNKNTKELNNENLNSSSNEKIRPAQTIEIDQPVKVENNLINSGNEAKVYGVYDPGENNFSLIY